MQRRIESQINYARQYSIGLDIRYATGSTLTHNKTRKAGPMFREKHIMTRLHLDRRTLLGAGLGVLATPGSLMAQTWPQGRTIKLVVPFPPGGATDG
jgi:hypothetical protein